MAESSLIVCISLLTLYHTITMANSESYLGINLGQFSDDLPSTGQTLRLLRSMQIQHLRIYNSSHSILSNLTNSGVEIVIGISNEEIVGKLAERPGLAAAWVEENVVPYYPAVNITLITVGDEALTSNNLTLMTSVVRAMENVKNALKNGSLGDGIRVTTVHSMALLNQSAPPSLGMFGDIPEINTTLGFLNDNDSPFAIKPYPFFAYQNDSRDDMLAYCLFEPNSGVFDNGSSKNYSNMFDAQVDAVYSALVRMGYAHLTILVMETGWPHAGADDESGANIENAKAYNGNLIAHLRSQSGTPLMPGKFPYTYIYALFDEDLKLGKRSQRAFGIYKTDLTPNYDVGLVNSTDTNTSFDKPGGGNRNIASNNHRSTMFAVYSLLGVAIFLCLVVCYCVSSKKPDNRPVNNPPNVPSNPVFLQDQ